MSHRDYHRNYNQNIDKVIQLLQLREQNRSQGNKNKNVFDDIMQHGTTGALLGGMAGPGGMAIGAGVGAGVGLIRSLFEGDNQSENNASDEQIMRAIDELLQQERQNRQIEMSRNYDRSVVRRSESVRSGRSGRSMVRRTGSVRSGGSDRDIDCMCSQFQRALDMVRDEGLEINITIRSDSSNPHRSVRGGRNHAITYDNYYNDVSDCDSD